MRIWKQGLYGAAGGLVGALAMQLFRLRWEARPAASAESAIYGFDEEADLNAVAQLGRLLNFPAPSKPESLKVALVLHYAFGAMSGAAYSLVADRYPPARSGFGMAFGAALWAVGDEAAITLTGLSDPRAKKVSSHISALAAHLLFGVATELVRKTALRVVP